MPFDGTSTSAQYETQSLLARTFERAAEIIETKGLMQRNYHGPKGEVCCYQAMYEACGETQADFYEVHHAFEETITLPSDSSRMTGTCAWNNQRGRTKEQAAAAFRRAAKAHA